MLKYRRAFLIVAAVGMGAVVVADLWGPRTTSLRQFDPEDVAWKETEMWRSYYGRERLRLFNQLAALLRRQYRLPLLRSYFEIMAATGGKPCCYATGFPSKSVLPKPTGRKFMNSCACPGCRCGMP